MSLKYFLSFLAFILLLNDDHAQTVPISAGNVNQHPIPYNFSNSRESIMRLYSLELKPDSIILLNDLIDSNSYSYAEYNIGTGVIQNITLSVDRPISETGRAQAWVNRESNQGWVAKSFVRRTSVGFNYDQFIGSRWRIYSRGSWNLEDLEQNGGVLDSTNYSFITEGTDAINNSANTWLTDAYSRSSNHNGVVGATFRLIDYDSLQLYAGIDNGLNRAKFVYYDGLPYGLYYQNFTNDTILSVHDSSRLFEYKVSPSISFFKIGSGIIDRISASLGASQSWYWFDNNGRKSTPTNQRIFTVGEVNAGRIKTFWKGQYFTEGRNKGNYTYQNKWRYNLISADTSKNSKAGVYAVIDGGRKLPSIFSTRYISQVTSVANDLESISSSGYKLGFDVVIGQLSGIAAAGYTKYLNYIYLDSKANMNQKRQALEIYTAELGFSYRNKWLSLQSYGAYQWNNRSNIYALPEWVNNNTVTLHWSLFKKRLKLQSGMRTTYYSQFFTQGYIPFLNSYYAQSFNKFDRYFQADAFIMTRIKTVDIGFNAYNLLYGVLDDNPIIAPNLPVVPRYFSLHFSWNFKN